MARTSAAARWSELIDKHEASGLTIRAFAKQHDVNARTLAWWRCRLGRTSTQSATRFVELTVAKPSMAGSEPDPTVVLALEGYPAHIVVDRQTDLSLLKALLAALC